jgi:hypothetical protein
MLFVDFANVNALDTEMARYLIIIFNNIFFKVKVK